MSDADNIHLHTRGRGLDAEGSRTILTNAGIEVTLLSGGPWNPAAQEDGRGLLGFLVAEGLLTGEVALHSSVSARLLGPGDLLACSGSLEQELPATTTWRAESGTRVVLLDRERVLRLRQWPTMAADLVSSAAEQLHRASLLQTVAHLPRVEDRIVALLWLLADRWGRVSSDGVLLPMTLTHLSIGRLVGARRPTISLALKRLGERGTVTRRPDGGWLLERDSATLLTPGGPRPALGGLNGGEAVMPRAAAR